LGSKHAKDMSQRNGIAGGLCHNMGLQDII